MPGHEVDSQNPPSTSGKSSSGRLTDTNSNGLFDRFLSRSSSISLSTSKSSKLSMHDGDGVAADPWTIFPPNSNRHRKSSKSSSSGLPLNTPAAGSPHSLDENPSSPGKSPREDLAHATGPIKSIRHKFRRSISDPDDGSQLGSSTLGLANGANSSNPGRGRLGNHSGRSLNPARARSFDVSDNVISDHAGRHTGGDDNEEKQTAEGQYASGTLRKGSLHALQFFLSKAGSKASSWVSSNSNEPRISSARRDRMRREASQAQLQKYDAFADHSGLHQIPHQQSASDLNLLSDADRLEIHFQDTYNFDNIGQFKRVLVLVAIYEALYCLAGTSHISTRTSDFSSP